jgi:hypothetical protein
MEINAHFQSLTEQEESTSKNRMHHTEFRMTLSKNATCGVHDDTKIKGIL